jgi:hypothetical protein
MLMTSLHQGEWLPMRACRWPGSLSPAVQANHLQVVLAGDWLCPPSSISSIAFVVSSAAARSCLALRSIAIIRALYLSVISLKLAEALPSRPQIEWECLNLGVVLRRLVFGSSVVETLTLGALKAHRNLL